MSTLALGTHFVSLDEPCFSLKETLAPGPGYHGVHRYQDVAVIRGDTVAHYRRDLGPAEDFTSDEFVIPGGVRDPWTGRLYVEHRVGELVDLAEHLRSNKYEPPPRPEPHDLVQLYYELPEREQIERVKRSSFSRLAKIQRD